MTALQTTPQEPTAAPSSDRQTTPADHDRILAQIAELQRLPWAELKERWRALMGAEAPTHNRQFIVKRLAHRLQEQIYGGLSDWATQRLQEVAAENGIDADGRIQRPPADRGDRPVTGTRFIREWDGKRYEVTTTADGYEFEGRPYRSLSAIAKAITGTQWNGKVFFGLKSQAGGGA